MAANELVFAQLTFRDRLAPPPLDFDLWELRKNLLC